MTEFLAAHYAWIKALHIIAVVAWMAALLYLPRLFIYHHQAAPGGEAAQAFVVMERRLLKGIGTPALVAVWVLAGLMIAANPVLLKTGWFHVKLACVLGISGVHGFYAASQRRFEQDDRPRTERFWRMINEAPFVLMIGVVFLAVLKPF
ncbi:MAG: protoporphyrinogen oxidase HemJ [Pseudomonadota bacterium]